MTRAKSPPARTAAARPVPARPGHTPLIRSIGTDAGDQPVSLIAEFRNKDRLPVCPKCSSKHLSLEWYSPIKTYLYEQDEAGNFLYKGRGKTQEQGHVQAGCPICEHTWRLKGIRRLDEFTAFRNRIKGLANLLQESEMPDPDDE